MHRSENTVSTCAQIEGGLTEGADLLEALAAAHMKLPDVMTDAELVHPPAGRKVEALVVMAVFQCCLAG